MLPSTPTVSALGAVMAFLYSSYIVLNAVLSSVLGTVIDKDFAAHNNIINSLKSVGGIQFSVCSGIILLATMVPKGALSLNPKAIEGVHNEQEFEEDSSVNSVRKSDVEGGRREKVETH